MILSLNAWEIFRLDVTHLATTATCKRSFSMMKLIRSDIKSIMTNWRMNHLAVLKYYPEYLMETKVEDVISEFIAVNDICLRQFGYVNRE